MAEQMLPAVDASCVVFLLIQFFAAFTKKEDRANSSKIIGWVLFSTAVCGCAEAFVVSNSGRVPDALLWIFAFVFYSGRAVTCSLFIIYCFVYIREKTDISRWLFFAPLLITFMDFCYTVFRILSGSLYAIEGNRLVATGTMPVVRIILPAVLTVYLILVALSKYRHIGKRSVLILGAFGILPISVSAITIIKGCIDYSLPAGAVACSIVAMLMDNKISNEKYREHTKQLLKVQKDLKQRLDIIQSMTTVYFASYYIDIEHDSFIELSAKENIRNLINISGPAQENLNLVCEKLIEPEWSESMKEFVDLSTINERLKDKTVLTREYVGTASGWSIAYFIAGKRDKNGNLKHVFYACRTIHDEKAREHEQNKRLEEWNDTISNAGIGTWNIIIRDGEQPRMQGNKKMIDLLGLEQDKLSEESLYCWWHDRIEAESLPSVARSVEEMKDRKFSENTYLWNHPTMGKIYVRCGGTSKYLDDGTCILSGYHADVTDIVLQEELKRRTKELEENQHKVTQMNISLLDALGTVVEFRSLESGDHVKRVMTFTKVLLEKVKQEFPEFSLTDEQIVLMSRAAALHDVGKIAIADDILKAPRKLTVEEFAEMKKHTTYGCEILEKFKFVEHNEFYKYCYDICRWHHEKADGKGYPDGLVESEIPIYCQITAVADCFDALVSKRVYKDAKTCEESFNMIMNGECGVFSQTVLRCFELAKKDLFQAVESDSASEG